MSDLANASRLARLMTAWVPGVDLKPLLDELAERVREELDYEKEAASQRAFATAFRDDPEVVVPDVLGAGHTVIISEWLEGTPLSRIIADGTQQQRDAAGSALHPVPALVARAGRAAARRPAPGQLPDHPRRALRRPGLRGRGAPARRVPADRRQPPAHRDERRRRGRARRPARGGVREDAPPRSTRRACWTSSTRSSIPPGPRPSSSAASGCAGSSPGSTTRATRTSRSGCSSTCPRTTC